MERCIFCGWNRRTAFPSIRFHMIPREPGMKQLMWMHAIDKKCAAEGQRYEQNPRDRVCSVHFRQGRPSNDKSHEDFVPHLYLTSEPPAEVLNYLENLADSKSGGEKEIMPEKKNEAVHGEYKAHVNPMNPNKIEVSKISRPSILQRKRKRDPVVSVPVEEPPVQETVEEQVEVGEGGSELARSAPDMFAASHPDHRMAPNAQPREDPPGQRRVKLQCISRSVIETLGARPGQIVIIKRRIPKNSRRNTVAGE